jgi:hypothetical protein
MPVEANSTGGQGSRRAVAPSGGGGGDDDDDDDDRDGESVNMKMWFAYVHIHSFRNLTTNPQPLPKRVLCKVQPNAFSSKLQSPLIFLKVVQHLPKSFSFSFLLFNPTLYFSFNNVFPNTISTQDVTNPISLSFLLSM